MSAPKMSHSSGGRRTPPLTLSAAKQAGSGTLVCARPRNHPGKSFKLTQIGVRRGMPEQSAHGDNLALVMEGMGQNMMQDERWTADGKVSIRKAQLYVAADLLIRQAGQICEGLLANIAL